MSVRLPSSSRRCTALPFSTPRVHNPLYIQPRAFPPFTLGLPCFKNEQKRVKTKTNKQTYSFFFFFFFLGETSTIGGCFFVGLLFREHPKAQPEGGFRRSPGSNLRPLVYKASELTTAPRRLRTLFFFSWARPVL